MYIEMCVCVCMNSSEELMLFGSYLCRGRGEAAGAATSCFHHGDDGGEDGARKGALKEGGRREGGEVAYRRMQRKRGGVSKEA